MFSADLSWTGPDTEKVGERRERIARERSTPSMASSARSSGSSKASVSSVAEDRELWWTSSIRKAKSLKPNNKARPGTSRSAATGQSRKESSSLHQRVESELLRELRDPTLQPAWTLSSTLSPTLPSGAPLDPPVCEVPELEGDISSRGTNSSGSRSSHERQWSLKSPIGINVIDEVHEVQLLNPRSFIARAARGGFAHGEPDDNTSVSRARDKDKRRAYSVRIDKRPDLESLKLQDRQEKTIVPVPPVYPSYASSLGMSNLTAWRLPSDREHAPSKDELRPSKQLQSDSVLNGIAVAHSSLLELTRFQRFIRRMDSAGPKVILDRLKEEWHDPVDAEANEELRLEKQLWVLTAFQLQSLGGSKMAPQPQCNTGKILELYGNLAEVYQLSAMHSRQKVQYLTTDPQRPMPLPGNVSYLTVSQPGEVPFPWPDSTFSHIRASTLPSLVPSSEVPELLRECYRLLAPGGMLEIRVMDAAPVRKTAGPKMRGWIEERLALNLERQFRCSKPCMLVPAWVVDAGFALANAADNAQLMRLPCTVDEESSDIESELKMRVGHALWQDIWGNYVDEDPDETTWWWNNAEVMQECLERQTVFECGAIFARKE